jgi:hypothetical protein
LSKLRVHDMAGEFGISADEVIALLRQMDVPVRSHLSLLTDDQVSRIRARWEREKRVRAEKAQPAPAAAPRRRRTAAAEVAPTPEPEVVAAAPAVRRRRAADLPEPTSEPTPEPVAAAPAAPVAVASPVVDVPTPTPVADVAPVTPVVVEPVRQVEREAAPIAPVPAPEVAAPVAATPAPAPAPAAPVAEPVAPVVAATPAVAPPAAAPSVPPAEPPAAPVAAAPAPTPASTLPPDRPRPRPVVPGAPRPRPVASASPNFGSARPIASAAPGGGLSQGQRRDDRRPSGPPGTGQQGGGAVGTGQSGMSQGGGQSQQRRGKKGKRGAVDQEAVSANITKTMTAMRGAPQRGRAGRRFGRRNARGGSRRSAPRPRSASGRPCASTSSSRSPNSRRSSASPPRRSWASRSRRSVSWSPSISVSTSTRSNSSPASSASRPSRKATTPPTSPTSRSRTPRGSPSASARRHHHGSRRPRQDVAARLHPQGQRGRRRSRRHHAAHRCLPRRSGGQAHSSRSSTPPVTRRSPPCVPAVPRSPTSSSSSSRPTTRSCRRPSRRFRTPRAPACRSSSPSTRSICPRPTSPRSSRTCCSTTSCSKSSVVPCCTRRSRPRRAPASPNCSSRFCCSPTSSSSRPTPTAAPVGSVVEAQLDQGKGPVATVLVQNGTLKVGDDYICGIHSGRVRAMLDERGKQVKSAGPAIPVQILGLTGVPMAGDQLLVVDDATAAREIAQRRERLDREAKSRRTTRGVVSLEDFMSQAAAGQKRQLRLVIKADQGGPAEALADALGQLSNPKCRSKSCTAASVRSPRATSCSPRRRGPSSSASTCVPTTTPAQAAEREGVDIKLYRIIYEAVADVKAGARGDAAPGRARSGIRRGRGARGLQGGARRHHRRLHRALGQHQPEGTRVRVIRDGVEIYDGAIASLRRFKDDVNEVKEGYECGIGIENFNDVKIGDVFECYRTEEVARTLDHSCQAPEEGAWANRGVLTASPRRFVQKSRPSCGRREGSPSSRRSSRSRESTSRATFGTRTVFVSLMGDVPTRSPHVEGLGSVASFLRSAPGQVAPVAVGSGDPFQDRRERGARRRASSTLLAQVRVMSGTIGTRTPCRRRWRRSRPRVQRPTSTVPWLCAQSPEDPTVLDGLLLCGQARGCFVA